MVNVGGLIMYDVHASVVFWAFSGKNVTEDYRFVMVGTFNNFCFEPTFLPQQLIQNLLKKSSAGSQHAGLIAIS